MLTTTTRYALRALAKLAQLPKGEMIRGEELSDQTGIPANYLSKIMATLRHGGIVEAVRGYNGGYRLDKLARNIYIVDVMELFEGVRNHPKCLLGEDHECSDDMACSAHVRYRRVHLAYLRFLEKTTIASISKKKSVKAE